MKILLSIIAIFSAAQLGAIAADKEASAYPLTTCVVSDEKLGGDMGKPYVFEYKGQTVELCCSGCKKEFDKDPAKFLEKIKAAEKKD